MVAFLKRFERLIIHALIVMMMAITLLTTVELARTIIRDIITPPIVLLEINEMLELFGLFLLVLIGLELLETIKAYLLEEVVHVELVIEVALIAIARKVIILDLEKYSHLTLIGIAALILSIAVAIFAVKRMIVPKTPSSGNLSSIEHNE